MGQYSALEVLIMSENKRNGRGAFGKRSYIALALCACALVLTGVLYYRHAEPQEEAEDVTVGNIQPSQEKEDLPVLATQPEELASPTEQTQTPSVSTSLSVMYPVVGENVYGYAMETLSYNETTRDWRVHNGIDLAAEEGTEVVAAAEGDVYTVYEDDTMGTTVVIRHLGGYTTKYASLAPEVKVTAGEHVTMGQVLGTVSTSAIVERSLAPHVHFSVTYQDAPIDPMQFLALGN